MQGQDILRRWRASSGSRLKRRLFSRALGVAVPYSGTIKADVEELEAGRAVISMREHRRVRNHLRSVHAIALVNLGELCSGLALLTGLPEGMRGIVTGLSVEYLKKARGRLLATCACDPPSTAETTDFEVVARLTDGEGDEVAVVTVRWRIGPTR